MATSKRTPAKRRKTTPKSQLTGLKSIDINKDVKKPAMNAATLIAGMWLGKKVIVSVEKAINKTDEATNGIVSGIFGVDGKKLTTPIVGCMIGLAVHKFVEQPEFKAIGLGIAISSGLEGYKAVTSKDLLAGIDDGVMLPGIGNLSLSEMEIAKAVQEIDAASNNDIRGLENTDVEEAVIAADDDIEVQ